MVQTAFNSGGVSGLAGAGVELTDVAITATALNTLNASTAGVVNAATVQSISGVLSSVQASYDANAAGTIAGLGNEVVTLLDTTADAGALNTLDASTTGLITGAAVATVTGTAAAANTALGSTGLNLPNAQYVGAGGTISATELLSLAANGGVDAQQYTVITGLLADVQAARNNANIVNIGVQDVRLLDASAQASDLNALDAGFIGVVNAGSIATVQGAITDLTTAFQATGITQLGNQAVTLSDTTADAAALNALDKLTTGIIDAGSVTDLTGTATAQAEARDSAGIVNLPLPAPVLSTPSPSPAPAPSQAAASAPATTTVAPTPEDTGSSSSGGEKTEFTGTNPVDPIIGDDGANRLVPLVAGSFRLEGKLGADDFVFDVAQKFSRRTADVVVDFNSAEGDEFILGSDAFEGLTRIKFKTVDSKKGLKKALASKKTIVYNQDNGQLYYNANGKQRGAGSDGGQFATIENLADLTGSDFTIV